MSFSRMSVLAAACGGLALAGSAPSLSAQDSTSRKSFPIPHVLEVVGQAIDQPAPAGMTPADRQGYAAETAWLKTEVDALKQTLETESRQFNTLSNASKARHDIAMNAIRNMKA